MAPACLKCLFWSRKHLADIFLVKMVAVFLNEQPAKPVLRTAEKPSHSHGARLLFLIKYENKARPYLLRSRFLGVDIGGGLGVLREIRCTEREQRGVRPHNNLL